jgi:uncharacterized protein DUF2516
MPMASAPFLFYHQVEYFVTWALLVVCLVVEVVALVNCLTQRADAFPVVGSLSKQAWLAILGGSVLATMVCGLLNVTFSIFAFVAIIAASIYMLDVRPALRDATNGSSSW